MPKIFNFRGPTKVRPFSESHEDSEDEEEPEDRGAYVLRTKRKCRDIVILLLFLGFWSGMGLIAIVALRRGDPYRLILGSDYEGRTCGVNQFAEKQNIYYPRIHEDLLDAAMKGKSPLQAQFYGICVDKCPQIGSIICTSEVQRDLDNGEEHRRPDRMVDLRFSQGPCWYVTMKTAPMLSRCFPINDANKSVTGKCVNPLGGYFDHNSTEGRQFYTNGEPNENCETIEYKTVTYARVAGQKNPMIDQLKQFTSMISQWAGDILMTKELILLIGGAGAFVIGFFWLVLIKFLAGCIVWSTVYAVLLVCAALTGGLGIKAGLIGESELASLSNKASQVDLESQMPPEMLKAEENLEIYEAATYVMAFVTVVILVIIIFMRHKIKVAIGIIRQAGAVLRNAPFLTLFPVIPFCLLMLLFGYWAIIASYIISASQITTSDLISAANDHVSGKLVEFGFNASLVQGQNVSFLGPPISLHSNNATNATSFLGLKSFDPNQDLVQACFAYHFFGFLWTNQLIQALSICTISSVVCKFYWSRKKSSVGRLPILRSFLDCFRFHLGSLLFGALIIALVQFIRAVLMYIDHKTKALQERNKVVKIAMKLISCCMYCLEKCLKFISRNAYIMIAMKGKSFCSATRDAFGLLFANLAQIAITATMAGLFLVLAKIVITLGCAGAMFYMLTTIEQFRPGAEMELSSPIIPVVLTSLLGFFVGSAFINVYGIAIDTVLLCFCEDKRVNEEGTYFMSKELQHCLGASSSSTKGTEK